MNPQSPTPSPHPAFVATEPNAGSTSLSPIEAVHDLKRELLRVVLAKTLKKNGVPPQWISGEVNTMTLPGGESWIEVRFAVQVDEPRFLACLTSFQADFERRLIGISPDANEWLSRIAWTLTPDPAHSLAMPPAEYWEQVASDRLAPPPKA